jgi:hypothetical protein
MDCPSPCAAGKACGSTLAKPIGADGPIGQIIFPVYSILMVKPRRQGGAALKIKALVKPYFFSTFLVYYPQNSF